MRFEVLSLLYQATEGGVERPLNVVKFTEDIGTWELELYRVVEWLDRRGFVRYLGAGPTVSLTERGVDYIEKEARRRKSIRDER